MAYRKRYGKRKSYKKRNTKRTFVKRTYRRKRYLPRNDQWKKHTARLCYHEIITLDAPAAGGAVEFNFACNDAGDPNHTGTGHQPMGFDQLCPGKYDHFTVIGSTCTVRYLTLANAAIDPPHL